MSPALMLPVEEPYEPQFRIVHQKVVLDVDLVGRKLSGSTEIYIAPLSNDITELRFNARQITITKVMVNGKKAAAKFVEPYGLISASKSATVFQYHLFQQKVERVLGKDGKVKEELVITLPKNFRPTVPTGSYSSLHDAIKQEDGIDPALAEDPFSLDAASITVGIDFTLKSARDGIAFVGCDQDDLRFPHCYTTGSPYPGATSCIFPTMDSLYERWTWDILLTTPRTLGDAWRAKSKSSVATSDAGGDEKEKTPAPRNDEDDLDITACCSGEFVTEYENPESPTKKTMKFRHTVPVSSQSVAFAVGPFQKINLSEFRNEEEDDKMGTNVVEVVGYALPGREAEVRNTCLFMPKAVDFFVVDIGLFPFSKTFKVCFVDDMVQDYVSSASICMASNRLLFPFEALDPIFPSTYALANGLVEQWLGVNIIPERWEDLWLIIGLARYKLGMFVKKLFGNNEYRFRLKRDAERVCETDIGRPSLVEHGIQVPLEEADLEFIKLKAPVVISILERRLAKASGSLVLDRVIARVLINAKTGDLPGNALGTTGFMRLCEKYSHTKVDPFFQQWVYGSGYPRFEVGQRFNKKKMIVELNIRQVQMIEAPKRRVTPESFISDAWQHQIGQQETPALAVFTGPMTIRIHEADGTPYEHVIEIRELSQKLEIPYNTKYKRLKRSRRQKERAAAAAGMELDVQNEDVLLYCLGDVLQSEEDIQAWDIEEWSKEEEERMANESFEWIRLDSDFEWICTMTINQPDYMFLSQLQQDRDVVAQYESIQYFAHARETRLVSSILLRTLMDQRYYYGIRVAAAQALPKCATQELMWIGKRHLIKAFREFFCISSSAMPQSNDFSNAMSYHVQKAIPQALATIRNGSGGCPLDVQRFLLDLLKYNDNSNNAFTDCFYIAGLIDALGTSLLSKEYDDEGILDMDREYADDVRAMCLEEIERYQRLDQWLPCYRNVISGAAINAKRRLVDAGVLSKNYRELLLYTREDTLDSLRATAFEALIDPEMLEKRGMVHYVFYILGKDPSRYIRHSVLRILVRVLGAVAVTSAKTADRQAETEEINFLLDDPEAQANSRQQSAARENIDGAVKNLKAKLSGNVDFQRGIWSAVQSRKLGILDVRLMLQLCRLLYKPKNSLMVVLKGKKHLTVKHEGKGKLHFKWVYKNWPTFEPPPPPPQPARPLGPDGKPRKFLIKLKATLPESPEPNRSAPTPPSTTSNGLQETPPHNKKRKLSASTPTQPKKTKLVLKRPKIQEEWSFKDDPELGFDLDEAIAEE